MSTIDLTQEISAFLRERPALLRSVGARWVVFVGQKCEGTFAHFDEAAQFAISRFATQPFLIRHTDVTEPQIPLLVVED